MGKQKADLLQGTVEMLVLRLLRGGPLHGWDIMQRITLVSDDALAVNPGSLYPALHRLEERGHVAAEWGASENKRRAKFYELTTAGLEQLDRETAQWKRFAGAVEVILRDA